MLARRRLRNGLELFATATSSAWTTFGWHPRGRTDGGWAGLVSASPTATSADAGETAASKRSGTDWLSTSFSARSRRRARHGGTGQQLNVGKRRSFNSSSLARLNNRRLSTSWLYSRRRAVPEDRLRDLRRRRITSSNNGLESLESLGRLYCNVQQNDCWLTGLLHTTGSNFAR